MIKNFLFSLILMVLCAFSNAQNYGNEWINYEYDYYRIPVSTDGMYRVNHSALSSFSDILIAPLSSYRLFYRGVEQPILVYDADGDNFFDNNDYFEFYGRRNDGTIDTILLDDITQHTNSYYSLINDESSYFLTYDITTSGLRFQPETDVNFSAYTSAAHCVREVLTTYTTNKYFEMYGPKVSNYEGWFDSYVDIATPSTTKSLSTGKAVGGLNAELEVMFVSNSNMASGLSVNHHVQIAFLGGVQLDTAFLGKVSVKKSFSFSSSLLGSALDLTFSVVNDLGITSDKNALSWIKLRYPHSFDFEGKSIFEFDLPNSGSSKTRIDVTNFTASTGLPRLYDITNSKVITVVNESGTYKALIPDTGDSFRKCIMVSSEGVTPVTGGIERVSFIDYSATGFNSDYIIVTHSSLMSKANEYKAYRNSTGFSTLVVDVDQLYDQFAFGVQKHPAGIRNFTRFLIDNYDSIPKYMLLIGKSVKFSDARKNTYSDSVAYSITTVPSFGSPATDNLFTAGLNGTNFESAIPTGRIGARNPGQVEIYLNKLMVFESEINDPWKKNVIHFGGGGSTAEQAEIDSYLNMYKDQIEGIHYGARVFDFRKTSSDPIEISTTDSITDLISNGVSLLTFFGHGSTAGFDISIDNPSVYNNEGKYPMIIANSCLSGDIHILNSNINETWVFNEKGCIAFLASTGEAFKQYLHGYSTNLYQQIAYNSYGLSVGEQMQNTVKAYQEDYLTNNYVRNTCYEFSLHGDPAVKVSSFNKPDLAITPSDVYFVPSVITSELDSFEVFLGISNLGRATLDTFLVQVKRTLPNLQDTTLYFQKPGLMYRDTISFKMPVNKLNGPGLNTFEISVDVLGEIDENNEFNNELNVDKLILSGDLSPIWPYKYAIYPDEHVTLKASTEDVFLDETSFTFEVDTSDAFSTSSPAFLTTTVNSTGGVINWELPFTLQDSMIYFWRVCKTPTGDETPKWKESSFIYIPGKTGWSQAHFQQFKNDDFKYIEYNRDERSFDYINTPDGLYCHNIGSVSSDGDLTYYNYTRVAFFLNDFRMDYSSCYTNFKMHVAVIDGFSHTFWQYDTCSGRHRPDLYMKYPDYYSWVDYPTARQDMVEFINSVPDGNYVLVYSFRSGLFDDWEEPILLAFESYGAANIRDVPQNNPYILFFRKGYPSTVQEIIGDSPTDEIDLFADLPSDYTQGDITSEIIGPGTNWQTLHWRQNASELLTYDEARLSLLGINSDLSEDTIISGLTPPDYDILDIPASADNYSKLKFVLETRDDTLKTPPQLSKWQLTYDGAPETALDPNGGYFFERDTVFEGDQITFSLATRNISSYDMDSVLILYMLMDRNYNIDTLALKRCRTHPAGDVLIDTISFSTLGLSGLNSIWMEVNPIDALTGDYDQTEMYHFNNITQKFFYVRSDNENPLLDVTFDGVHILNGDIVSAKPQVVIQLKDENKYLALNDTSLFAVFLKKLPEGEAQRIWFNDISGSEIMEWVPADLPNNSCKIIYNPVFATDGLYEIQVQALDRSGNESGDNDYRIDFEIINQSTITDIFNYPNPFSTSTRFVFVLTGSEIPDDLRIQITTVTGKLVREITLDEIGPVNIGRNISQFAWDGKDMYGDQLANGVYFYRVFTKLNGESIEKRKTGAESYFKKGFGKMYLMR
ncbi:MAG: hypothetical protein A2W91_13855 [Bacteroidetes bacterium GWF2_38_335]|nr:MAG: hypothetical protein A2W91_13855 [Bacteroidetes bacterium GWF2_38_335]OFY77800.1 MAG: hypothetical protein A2281_15545 [Bacteroidetes bacterium RIFOXYA12_FULL_38_20]HBS87394.1 hypothetical protein [Bacteroidales bacterium]